ncbi:MAG: spore photoproduct lyase family protein [Gammaproteobacteria bacterium]
MFDTLYIEKQIAGHARTQDICARFPNATRVECDRYGEVFNPKSQNFRLQKRRPSLILAHKHHGRVLETPPGYGLGGNRNYYFSHMLNCLYDCRYCFLQGMYRSAHYVLFVNYEDFETDMETLLAQSDNEPCWFFSGYDCDSLALEPVSAFMQHFLPFFSKRPLAHIELRTKSTQIRSLLKMEPIPNVVIAFSFTPQEIYRELEHKVPTLERRLQAMLQLQQAGWQLGLRFDPLIYQQGYQAQYRRLFQQLFSQLDSEQLHSVSLGTFRLPRSYFRNIVQLYPDEPLFAGTYSVDNGMISYPQSLEQEMTAFCTRELLQHIPESVLFPCTLAA